MMKPLSFETLHDAEGSVTLGWAGDSVLYVVAEGGLSGELGGHLAAAVQKLAAGFSGIHYFCDASGLSRYDLLARSAFVRMALANRRRFASFTVLAWPATASRAADGLTAALGDTCSILRDSEEFERRLLEVAPLARYRLDPANIERFESVLRQQR